MLRPHIKTDIFVCDHCGNRKRLRSDNRHWCDNCHETPPVEMRNVRDKKMAEFARHSGRK
jgi:hypothetical protein